MGFRGIGAAKCLVESLPCSFTAEKQTGDVIRSNNIGASVRELRLICICYPEHAAV